jgi:phosphatidylglycerol:prolipoprotein diacylglycerol transferase
MHRTIVEFGELGVRSYGVMLVVAFWLGIELTSRLARRRGIDPARILDLGLVVLVASLAGSRLLYVVTHMGEYRGDWIGIFRIWEGGLTFYGGLVAGVTLGMIYLKGKGVPVLKTSDLVAPHLALGIAIARVGCFLNGCCFGKESDLPWAVVFPPDCQAGWMLPGKHLHPTQIYSALANLVIFVVLRRALSRKLADGVVFCAFMVLYGSWRFGIDYLRYYESGMYLGLVSITWNQVFSLAMIAIGLGLGLRLARRGEGDQHA